MTLNELRRELSSWAAWFGSNDVGGYNPVVYVSTEKGEELPLTFIEVGDSRFDGGVTLGYRGEKVASEGEAEESECGRQCAQQDTSVGR